MKNLIVLLGLMVFALQTSLAQSLVPLGKGSYSQTPPAYKAGRYDLFPWPDERGLGDKSYEMVYNRDIYVVENNTKPIPTNDWLTSIFKNKYCGELWAYPLTVSASSTGLLIEYPHEWNDAGSHMESNSELSLKGVDYSASAALANTWGDWTIDFIMPDEAKEMKVTLGHGLPFVWTEISEIEPLIEGNFTAVFNAAGEDVSFPITADYIGIEINGDYYGIYAPAGSSFDKQDHTIAISLPASNGFVIIGALPNKDLLEDYATYAYVIPRDSKVDFKYIEEDGKLYTTWNLETENLLGASNLNVIQGFIPHHYRTTDKGFDFETELDYDTPRGTMKSAKGNNFTFNYKFNGILPVFPTPQDYQVENSFDSTMVKQGIQEFTGNTVYGADTYWGGKDLLMKAQYAMIAKSMDMDEESETIQDNLVNALSDWYTFDPGETEYCFTYYPNWGGMVGYNPSYFSDEFTDHHFHYGYFSLASGILGLINPEFNQDYGPMAKLVASDYANWKRDDDLLPYFRTMDIWAGHSYAGGLVDGGNGQESSSEAMQSWGGLFMLAMATKDFEMRDAAIFGYVSEAQATAEYWFDRYKKSPEDEYPARNNISDNFEHPYNTNLESGGIGYWNWFSGNMGFNHAIQWIPWSPAMKYLYADPEFMQWEHDYVLENFVNNEDAWPDITSYYEGWAGIASIDILSTANPEAAVAKLQECRDNGLPVGTDALRHFNLHSDRTYGSVVWDRYIDYPLSSIYYNDKTESFTYVVFNNEPEERMFSVYDYETGLVAAFKAPPGQLTTYTTPPVLSRIVIESETITIESGESMQFTALIYDQYDASFEATPIWNVSGGGTINTNGLFTATTIGDYTLTCTSGEISETINIRVGDGPLVTTIELTVENYVIEQEQEMQFNAAVFDQYNDPSNEDLIWSVSGGGSINENGLFTASTEVGEFVISAEAGGLTQTIDIRVRMPLVNVALGKPAYASSTENVSFPPEKANDGVSSSTSRWSSDALDNQYWAVDLSGSYEVNYITIEWENAYAKSYEVYISNEELDDSDIEGHDWGTAIYTNSNGSAGVHTFTVMAEAKCLYVKCLERATSWGFSIMELQVFGLPVSGETSEMLVIDVLPKFEEISDFDSIQLSAKAYDQFGVEIPLTPTWGMLQDDEGTITGEGWYKPAEWVKGIVVVKAESDGVVGLGEIVVQPSYEKITAVIIDPESSESERMDIAQGTAYQFVAQVKNQFNWDVTGDISWSSSGGGSIASSGFYTATSLGDYEVYATCQGEKDTAFVTVTSIDGVNVALGKPTIASSTEAENYSSKAVDGSETTRWGSNWNAEDYWQVDLQAVYNLSTVQIMWDPAYAKQYTIQVSEDGAVWTIAHTQSSGSGGTENIDLSGYDAKYIKLNATERQLTNYGYSIYEFKVYASGVESTPELSTIQIEPSRLWLPQDSVFTFEAFAFDQFGDDFSADVIWSIMGSGSIDDGGQYTPNAAGTFYVSAKVGGLSNEAKVTVVSPEIEIVNQKPVCNILTPEAGRILINETFSIQAQAHDFDGGITRVECYVNDILLGTKTVQPYSFSWMPDTESEYVIYVKAYDESQHTQSSSVTYRGVTEINPPTLILSSPVSTKLILNESVDLIAEAIFFEERIDSVLFFVDETLLATQYATPYSQPWLPTINKDYEIYAMAYAENENIYSSDIVTVGLVLDSVAISPRISSVEFGQTQQFQLNGFDQNKYDYEISEVAWEVSNEGSLVDGMFSADRIGEFLITASYEGVIDTLTIEVSSSYAVPSLLALTSSQNAIVEDETAQFTCLVYDQDNKLMDAKVIYNCYLNHIDSAGLFKGKYTGTYQVQAMVVYTAGIITDTLIESLEISVYPKSTINIALDYLSVSAASNSSNAKWAVDNNLGTRWEPVADVDDLTWIVKLDTIYNIGAIAIDWETAAAQSYFIHTSTDSLNWEQAFHFNPEDTTRSLENHQVDSLAIYAPAQYVKFTGISRTYFVYGPSFWEFRIYEAAHTMGELHSINIIPQDASINEGLVLSLEAETLDAQGESIIADILWSVNSDEATISTDGTFLSTLAGVYEVGAVSGEIESITSVTVIDVSVVDSIYIFPEIDTISQYESKQFLVQAYDQFKREFSISYTWSTSAGEINENGMYTAQEPGVHKVYAESGGIMDSSVIVVLEIPALDSVFLSPKNTTMAIGAELQFEVSILDQFEQTYDTLVEWSSIGGSISDSGLFTSNTEGECQVFVKAGTASDSTTVYVSDTPTLVSIELSPIDTSIYIIANVQYQASTYDQFGDEYAAPITWLASNGDMDSNGLYQPTTVGTFTVSAQSNEVITVAKIKVTEVPVLTSIDVNPKNTTIPSSTPFQMNAIAYDQMGNVFDTQIAWKVPGGNISDDGIFSSSEQGVYQIIASSNEHSDTATITVSDTPTLVEIDLEPKDVVLLLGDSLQYTAIGFDQFGDVYKTTMRYTCSFGTLSENGLFLADKLGEFKVVVSSGFVKDSSLVIVKSNQQLSYILISPDTSILELGQSIQFIAQAYDQDTDRMDTPIIWHNSGSGELMDGFYTPTALGIDTVYASSSDVSSFVTFLVTDESLYLNSKEDNRIMVYPNPVQDKVSIDLNGLQAQQVLLFDNRGSLIVKKDVSHLDQSIMLNLNSLNAGMYHIVVVHDNEFSTHKITKQ